jgi:hypothetical protein
MADGSRQEESGRPSAVGRRLRAPDAERRQLDQLDIKQVVFR